ncbi:hypothetical protein C8R43DRAFT_1069506 [Mycena crocata]|nr:hypothetical protein C8R43DRAFT_1069506 [Mycena crocata]
MRFECSDTFAAAPEQTFDRNVTPGSQHYKLFISNDPPEISDISLIKAIVSKADARLAYLDSEITRLQDRLEGLHEERASLASYRAQNCGILSPLRKMPPEVLEEIFLWTLPSAGEVLRRGKSDTRDSPWLLTHISSVWRAVALSTSSLWSLVAIGYSGDRIDLSSPHLLSMTETQIQRAHNLRIHFHGSEDLDPQPQTEMFRCLAEYSSRWTELSIGLTSHLVPLMASLRDRLPCLRRLWIQWDQPESQEAVESIDCFETATSLLDAGVYNEHRYISVSLPAHHLTRYHLDGPWGRHKDILSRAQKLVEAHIDIDFDFDFEARRDSDIVNSPCLRRLFVSNTDILKYLKVPSLEEIGLDLPARQVDPNVMGHLEAFVGRSSCTLRTLALRGSPNHITAATILEKYPSITKLAIVLEGASRHISSKTGNALIAHLNVSSPSNSEPHAVVSPQLSEINIGCDDTFIDYKLYLEMLKSRWKADNCALKAATLIVDSEPGPEPATLQALELLRQDGLDLLVLPEGETAEIVMSRWIFRPFWD